MITKPHRFTVLFAHDPSQLMGPGFLFMMKHPIAGQYEDAFARISIV
jgi:hypothetical protein